MSNALTMLYELQDNLKDEIADCRSTSQRMIYNASISNRPLNIEKYLREHGREDAFSQVLTSVNDIVNELT